VSVEVGPIHLRWDHYRRGFEWLDVDSTPWHAQMALFESAEMGALSSRAVMVPAGHRGTLGPFPSAVFLVGIGKSVTVEHGVTSVRLRRCDILKIPAATEFSLSNTSSKPRVLFMTWADPGSTGTPDDDGRGISYFDWRTARGDTRWDQLPGSDRWGMHRTSYRNLKARGILLHLGRTPLGQGGPDHSIPANLLVLQLRGELEFRIGADSYVLSPRDILAIPANTPYSQRNIGLSESLSVSVTG
jgi:mannose-6-phosphate isomerase-like protein (cupin superfamily)